MYLLEEVKKKIEVNSKKIAIFVDMDEVVANYKFVEGKIYKVIEYYNDFKEGKTWN